MYAGHSNLVLPAAQGNQGKCRGSSVCYQGAGAVVTKRRSGAGAENNQMSLRVNGRRKRPESAAAWPGRGPSEGGPACGADSSLIDETALSWAESSVSWYLLFYP